MQPLADFLNHGIMPFVGRTTEIQRITQFWRTTTEAHNLRAISVIGEAGVGKSRLIEESMRHIIVAGGGFIHVKLYPESSMSIAPLLARAIWRSGIGQRLLAAEPGGRLSEIVAALSHLARLRPTILVIEDVHLLTGEALRDFGVLLGALEGELLTVLCATRPAETGSRGVLERYLVDEIELQGLSNADIDTLWKNVFQTSADTVIVSSLFEATAGNPLAIRSALRGALSSGALMLDTALKIWRPVVPQSALAGRLRENVRLISEGLAAHLCPREREACEQLASLGEIFAREAASALLDDADRMLDALTFKGVLVTSSSSIPPISGPASEYPLLTFTHTLVHKHFAQRKSVDRERLLRVVINDLPLYSALVFQTLGSLSISPKVSLNDIDLAFRRTVDVARLLDITPDWELGKGVLGAAEALIAARRNEWSRQKEREMESELLHFRLVLSKREMHTTEYESLVLQFIELTTEPTTEILLRCRLVALSHQYWLRTIRGRESRCEPLKEMNELLDRFPKLRHENAYVYFLFKVAYSASNLGDTNMLREIDGRLNEFLNGEDIPEERRETAWRMISPLLLGLFDTEQELATRIGIMTRLNSMADRRDTLITYRTIVMLGDLGRFDDALQAVREGIPSFREYGLSNDVFLARLHGLAAEAAIGEDLAAIASRLDELVGEFDRMAREHAEDLRHTVATLGILRGDIPWARTLLDRWQSAERHPQRRLPFLLSSPEERPDINEGTEILRNACELLAAPILRVCDLIRLYDVVELVELSVGNGVAPAAELRTAIHDALLGALEWLAERRLSACMTPLLHHHARYFDPAELVRWDKRIEEIAHRRRDLDRAGTETAKLRLTMLGTISTQTADGEIIKIRGSRLRVLLGLMVADRMLDRPLSYREFLRVAAGDEDAGYGENGTENARNIVKVSVHRLRESLGHDAILTDAETPQLNLQRIEVDILTAYRLLADAAEAARQEVLARAHSSLQQALDLIGSEVAFPSLYDTFFEAAREDFEIAVRATLLAVSKGLLREGDTSGAQGLLACGVRMMPGDQELAELLRDSLSASGKNADAERIRLEIAETV